MQRSEKGTPGRRNSTCKGLEGRMTRQVQEHNETGKMSRMVPISQGMKRKPRQDFAKTHCSLKLRPPQTSPRRHSPALLRLKHSVTRFGTEFWMALGEPSLRNCAAFPTDFSSRLHKVKKKKKWWLHSEVGKLSLERNCFRFLWKDYIWTEQGNSQKAFWNHKVITSS